MSRRSRITNFSRSVYACCQNGSFDRPNRLFSSVAMAYATAYGIEIVVQRVVADAGVEADLDVVVVASGPAQDRPHLPAEVALHFQDQAAHLPCRIVRSASAAAGRRTDTCRRTSCRSRPRRGSSRRCRGRVAGSSASRVRCTASACRMMSFAEDERRCRARLGRRVRRQRAERHRRRMAVDDDREERRQQRRCEERRGEPEHRIAVGQQLGTGLDAGPR